MEIEIMKYEEIEKQIAMKFEEIEKRVKERKEIERVLRKQIDKKLRITYLHQNFQLSQSS